MFVDGIVGTIDGAERYNIDNCKTNVIVTTTLGNCVGRNSRTY